MIKIRKPYYSAGGKYGWPGDPKGIGLNLSYLKQDGDLTVYVVSEKATYKIAAEKARRLVKHYNSFFTAGKTRLGTIPESAFELIEKKPAELKVSKNPFVNRPPKLF